MICHVQTKSQKAHQTFLWVDISTKVCYIKLLGEEYMNYIIEQIILAILMIELYPYTNVVSIAVGDADSFGVQPC